jgi:DNA-binding NtrC family response regulator
VGGETSLRVDARIIAATNRQLAKEVEKGHFRQDLYYRINVLTIRVPPLRERLEDIPFLVNQISARLATELQVPEITDIDEITMERMCRHNWPGNVRELRNEVERALIQFTGVGSGAKRSALDQLGGKVRKCSTGDLASLAGISLNKMLRDFKKSLIEEALERSGGKRVDAARLLGISRDALKQHMKSLGLLGAKSPRGVF